MKITFRTDYDGSIHSNNAEFINNNTISVDGLETGRDIARHQHQSIFKLLSHKTMFIALPENKVEDNGYEVVKVLLVNVDGELKVWNVNHGYLSIENKDVLFTTEEEAVEFVEKHNTYDTLVKKKNLLEELHKIALKSITENIEKLGAELGK